MPASDSSSQPNGEDEELHEALHSEPERLTHPIKDIKEKWKLVPAFLKVWLSCSGRSGGACTHPAAVSTASISAHSDRLRRLHVGITLQNFKQCLEAGLLVCPRASRRNSHNTQHPRPTSCYTKHSMLVTTQCWSTTRLMPSRYDPKKIV